MAPNPQDFLAHLRSDGYHPRSNKHSNSLAECIVRDLMQYCPIISEHARKLEIIYDLNFTIFTGTAEWNVDLVIGDPPIGLPGNSESAFDIVRGKPSTVRVAIELKTVMTEHRKAIKNRKRDFEAHHDHVHRYNPRAIAGGVLVANITDIFRSPLRNCDTTHANVRGLVEHCVEQIRAVSNRTSDNVPGLDAKAVVVLSMDNISYPSTSYCTRPPAPQIGDPLHYDAFIQRICSLYKDRFG